MVFKIKRLIVFAINLSFIGEYNEFINQTNLSNLEFSLIVL